MTELHTTSVLKHLLCRELDTQVWDYGTQFNDLWGMRLAITGHAIVVWADTPVDPAVRPVATEQYLTPFDWAITACSQYPKLRVTVLDLRGRQRDEADSAAGKEKLPYPALRWLRTQKEACVPWVRRLTVSELIDMQRIEDLCERLTDMSIAAADAPIVQPRDALRMLPICQVDLTRNADHHAIANLVGPLLLLRNPRKATPSDGIADHRVALRQILVAAGLIIPTPPTGGGDVLAGRGAAMDNILGERLSTLRLVLCDDQWHHGWLDWLCERTGVTLDSKKVDEVLRQSDDRPCQVAAGGKVEIWVSSGPNWLVEKMKLLLKATQPLQRRLPLTTESEDHNEVLLLDLRLFTGRPSQQKESFRKKLEELHESFRATVSKALSGDSARAAGADSDAQALTLLPRTLALADPLLPIVIFSSTGKRDVIEMVSDCPSVVSAFTKPRVLGIDTADARTIAEEALDIAIENAVNLLIRRRLVSDLQAARTRLALADPRPPQYGYVGVYVDESGQVDDTRRPFVMAAIVALYKNQEAEKQFRNRLRRELDTRWQKGSRITSEERAAVAEIVINCLPDAASVTLRAVAITKGSPLPPGPWYGPTAIWAHTALDLLHRMLLKQVIVTALGYSVRRQEVAKDARCSILTDIRSIPVQGLRLLPRELLKYGIEVFEVDTTGKRTRVSPARLNRVTKVKDAPLDWKWAFLGTSGVYPIVEDAFSEDIRLRERFKIDEARACKGLFDEGHPLVEWADYFAYTVFRATDSRGQVDVTQLEPWALSLIESSGIVTAYDINVAHLLDLARVAADGEPEKVVQRLVEEPDRCDAQGQTSLVDRCRVYIADELERRYTEALDEHGDIGDGPAVPSDHGKQPSWVAKLYVGNIHSEMTSGDLGHLFERFGAVKSAMVVRDHLTGRSRGFGFIEMKAAKDAEQARNSLHGTTVKGRRIAVRDKL